MRQARIKEPAGGCYHVISRVVDRRMALNDVEKERFRQLIRRVEGFCGVEILTWTCLDNHWHLLLHVPARREVDDAELLRRVKSLYGSKHARNLAETLRLKRQAGDLEAAEAIRAGYTYRMYDLSEFVKTLKQRFTQGYNRRHGRKGTLWEERFKSLLVESSGAGGDGVSTVAAYIDLNAVRAGIVTDPAEYRFCGYGEAAMGTGRRARAGITAVMQGLDQTGNWAAVSARYRKLLYVKGAPVEAGTSRSGPSPAFDARQVRCTLAAGGRIPARTPFRDTPAPPDCRPQPLARPTRP